MGHDIRVIHELTPPATSEDARAAALQYVRMVGGAARPDRAHEAAYARAVDEIAAATATLLDSLARVAPAPREDELARARAAVPADEAS